MGALSIEIREEMGVVERRATVMATLAPLFRFVERVSARKRGKKRRKQERGLMSS